MPGPLSLIALLAAIALACSLLLLWHALMHRPLPGCGADSGCAGVTASRWAYLGPIPVSAPATVMYAAMAGCAVLLQFRGGTLAWPVLVALCTAAALTEVWFIALQLILRRICIYCTVAHASALCAAALLPLAVPRIAQPAVLIGVAATAAFILAQLLITPRRYRVTMPAHALTDPLAITTAPPPTIPIAPLAPAAVARKLTLLGGRLILDAGAFPIIGKPDAPHLIAAVLDYTCEFCRELHPMLQHALDAFEGQLAIQTIHAPLERSCNPAIEIFNPLHADACAYSRLAIALWHCQAPRFVEFHDWLFAGPRPPALEITQRKAHELAGAENMAQALAAPRVAQQISDGVTVYRATQSGQLPKLLLPGGLFIGQISSAQKLIEVLRQQLQQQPPATAPSSSAGVFSQNPIG
jgi:uncharacterized membrane protein